jgi:hypothetical protein
MTDLLEIRGIITFVKALDGRKSLDHEVSYCLALAWIDLEHHQALGVCYCFKKVGKQGW